jgi:hypothetical protein
MNRRIHTGNLFMFAIHHRYTQRMLKMPSIAVLIILLYIVMVFVIAILP